MAAGKGLWYHRLPVHLSSESRHHWNPKTRKSITRAEMNGAAFLIRLPLALVVSLSCR